MRLFYKKSVAILVVAAAVVLIFLMCMLLAYLTQLSSLNQTIAKMEKMVEDIKAEKIDKQELLDYYQTDKYVIDWAIRNGRVPEDVLTYIPNTSNK